MSLRPAADVLSQEVQGEVVILDLKSQRYFGLDEIGARVWRSIADGSGVEKAIEALAESYEVDSETLRGDVESLLGELVAEGLLVSSAER